MNINRTNPNGIWSAENGIISMSSLKKYIEGHPESGDGKEMILWSKGDSNDPSINIPKEFFGKPINQKVVRLSKKVIENAKLINIESVKKNCDNVDFDFKSLFILFDNDDSGFVKLERYGSDIYYMHHWNCGRDNETNHYNSFNLTEKTFRFGEEQEIDIEKDILILQVLTYLFYGDITNRFIKAKQSIKLNPYTKFVNDSKTNIVFVDTLWRERISTEGFKVRGHFRLQPIGEGRKNKKLIWIEEFKKHGYNRKATVELNPLN